MLAGVSVAIGRHFNIDVTIVRVAFAVLTILGFTGLPYLGGIPLYLGGIPLYLACWLLIPEEGSDHSIASGLVKNLQSKSRLIAGVLFDSSSPSNRPRSSRYSSRPTPLGSRKYMLLSAPRSGPR